MSVIRPEVTAAIWRMREVIAALGVVGVGLWLMWLGGYLLVPVGGVVVALGGSWGVLAFRRMRFAQGVDAPGVVEVDEGQVGYFGPGIGGFVGLPDLVELRLVSVQGGRFWRLQQEDGQGLPGMDTQALVTALVPVPGERPSRGAVVAISDSVVIWRRAVRAALT
jgi:hypothetical protein